MVKLEERTEETVRIYFKETNTNEIKHHLPQKTKTADEAVADYRKSLLPGATSYGRTIWFDGVYIGDIWCYCIDLSETPNAMVSYCIFRQEYRSKGIATTALSMFLEEIAEKFHIPCVGAFLYADNFPSRRVLEKNRFVLKEEFTEDGRKSLYFQR